MSHADNDYQNVDAAPEDFRRGNKVYCYDYENWNGSGEPEIVTGTVVKRANIMDEVLVRWSNGVESPEFYRRLFKGKVPS